MVRKQICAGIQKVKCTMRISTISYRIGQGIEMEQRERDREREREMMGNPMFVVVNLFIINIKNTNLFVLHYQRPQVVDSRCRSEGG